MTGVSSDPEKALRLHHVGHAVAEIATAAPGFCSGLGYRAVSPIIHDPLQTAFVQFFQLSHAPLYLELVAPDGPESRLAAAARKGGGLHHLCYTAGSLEETVDVLACSGMRLIAEPKPAVAFAGRRICWLLGADRNLVELIERRFPEDACAPGQEPERR